MVLLCFCFYQVITFKILINLRNDHGVTENYQLMIQRI